MKLTNQQIASKVQGKMLSCLATNTEFSLPLSEIKELFQSEQCAYTGKRFADYNELSWERVNPKMGYVPGNVVLTTVEANSHKAQLDAFVKRDIIPDAMKIKLLRKAIYQLEEGLK